NGAFEGRGRSITHRLSSVRRERTVLFTLSHLPYPKGASHNGSTFYLTSRKSLAIAFTVLLAGNSRCKQRGFRDYLSSVESEG
ncbi:hypothetical protein A2U01_0056736, partial [Trifolium medium]|nr:hypothetical protein [Trifolium medium]